MLLSLVTTAFLMGVAGMPHCAFMCGAPCAAVFKHRLSVLHLAGKCLGYGLLGMAAAAGAGFVAHWARRWAFAQPLWLLVQAFALVLGLALLVLGRVPPQIEETGQALFRTLQARWAVASGKPVTRMMQRNKRLLDPLAGMAWVFVPCGLLYSASMVAVLSPTVWGGGLVMLAFAIPSAFGVWAAPALLRRVAAIHRLSRPAILVEAAQAGPRPGPVPVMWLTPVAVPAGVSRSIGIIPANPAVSPANDRLALHPDGPDPALADPAWAIRLSGLMLSIMAGWALYQQVLHQWRAWCT